MENKNLLLGHETITRDMASRLYIGLNGVDNGVMCLTIVKSRRPKSEEKNYVTLPQPPIR